MTKQCKIIIVDDHELFRDGLKFFLTQVVGLDVVGEASNGKEFLSLLNNIKPDLILMDIAMPVMDGIEASTIALQNDPDLKIIALSGFADEEYYLKMIQAGVSGFILKHGGKDEIEMAIHAVMRGENFFSKDIMRNFILRNDKEKKKSNDENNSFTARERQIISLICKGYTNIEIAEKLHISEKVVSKHIRQLLEKTGIKNSINLVLYAIKNGLVEA